MVLNIFIGIFFTAIAGAVIWAVGRLRADLKKEVNGKAKRKN